MTNPGMSIAKLIGQTWTHPLGVSCCPYGLIYLNKIILKKFVKFSHTGAQRTPCLNKCAWKDPRLVKNVNGDNYDFGKL